MAVVKLKRPDPDWSIAKSELERLIKEHNGTIDDVLMTPVMAAFILKTYNIDNRKLRINHVNGFAETLKRGGWENTGEAVVFSKEGILNNGQHRLEGIVKSGISALMDVRFGIARSAFAVTDTGAKRQGGDVLSVNGVRSPFACSAALKLLLAYEQGLPSAYTTSGKYRGNDEILKAYERWPDIERAVTITTRYLAKRKGFVNAASNAFVFLALRLADEDVVGDFLELLESGLTAHRNDAPRLLREKLMNDATLLRNDRVSTVERLALHIKAWNLWRAGERAKQLRYRIDEEFPELEITL